MGLFGKLFDKKECSICGGEIGLLGNRKLEDGNCCKECAKKLSPWFEERRHSTVEDIEKQLAYRENNKQKVAAFQVTREFSADSYHVYIDDTKGQFAVATGLNEQINPDIVDLAQITSCRLHVDQNRKEEQYRDSEGKMVDYDPPRYRYSYQYKIKLGVNSPWFDDMDFGLNTFEIEEQDRRRITDYETLGNQIVAALTGTSPAVSMDSMYGQPMGNGQQMNGMYGQMMGNAQQMNGMYGQPMGNGQQMNGMYGQMMGNGQQMNSMYGQAMGNGQQMNGMYGQAMGNAQPMNGMYGQMMGNGHPMGNGQQMNGMYGHPMGNGQQMNGMYGQAMGNGQQMNGMYGQTMSVHCDKCGWIPEDPNDIPKFCPFCGDPIDGNDLG